MWYQICILARGETVKKKSTVWFVSWFCGHSFQFGSVCSALLFLTTKREQDTVHICLLDFFTSTLNGKKKVAHSHEPNSTQLNQMVPHIFISWSISNSCDALLFLGEVWRHLWTWYRLAPCVFVSGKMVILLHVVQEFSQTKFFLYPWCFPLWIERSSEERRLFWLCDCSLVCLFVSGSFLSKNSRDCCVWNSQEIISLRNTHSSMFDTTVKVTELSCLSSKPGPTGFYTEMSPP